MSERREEGKTLPSRAATPNFELDIAWAIQNEGVVSPSNGTDEEDGTMLDLKTMKSMESDDSTHNEVNISKLLNLDADDADENAEKVAAKGVGGPRWSTDRRQATSRSPSQQVVVGVHFDPANPRLPHADDGTWKEEAKRTRPVQAAGVDFLRMRAILRCRRSQSQIVQFLPQEDGQTIRTVGRREHTPIPVPPAPSSMFTSPTMTTLTRKARPSTAHPLGSDKRRQRFVGHSFSVNHNRPKSALPAGSRASPFKTETFMHELSPPRDSLKLGLENLESDCLASLAIDTTKSNLSVSGLGCLSSPGRTKPKAASPESSFRHEAQRSGSARRSASTAPGPITQVSGRKYKNASPWQKNPASPVASSFVLTNMKERPSFQEKPQRRFGLLHGTLRSTSNPYASSSRSTSGPHTLSAERPGYVNVQIPWNVPMRQGSMGEGSVPGPAREGSIPTESSIPREGSVHSIPS